MNNFFKIILLFIVGVSIVSCSHSDNDTVPLRDYTEQAAKDMTNIEAFMHNHYMIVSADQDVTFELITDPSTQISIWDNQATYPLLSRDVTMTQDDQEIVYKIYYIKLTEGVGESPCNVDRVLTAYKGEYIYDSVDGEAHTIISKEFETQNDPQAYINLSGVIRGWSEIFPKFKSGTYTSNGNGTVSFDNFGAGVMFIPSGLAYYSGVQSGIPAYSPLIFNFKLYEIQRVDNDLDGIYSYLEDIGGPGTGNEHIPDGYVYVLEEGIANVDDTDGDFIPDFIDVDDDGDNFTTISETKFVNPSDPLELVHYYPYNGAAVDDPTTPYVDETQGIPSCSGDFTTPGRIRKYLDASCH
jgi:hypothetical protein